MSTDNHISSHKPGIAGQLGWFWGLGGFLFLLLFAIYRLAPFAVDALSQPLRWYHWLVFFGNLIFMAYYEGYKGFQKGYSPRVAARAYYLLYHPSWLLVLLSPFYCMAYFYATRRRIISAWVLTVGIIILIFIFARLPDPWKGLLDGGVVLGLSWGFTATVIAAFKVYTGSLDAIDPELPAELSEGK